MVSNLVDKARIAQAKIENYTQEQAREIAASIGWYAINNAERWAAMTFEETKMGNLESKIGRTKLRARGLMQDLNQAKTAGIVEVDEKKQLVKIAKPVGVIAGIVPTTIPVGVTFVKAMNALIGRNAIIFAPHPRAKLSTNTVVSDLRALLERLGHPPDLIQCIENPSMEATQELMRSCDLIVATGGGALVKAAYSSGKPAYGVGAGNCVTIIDETADLADAAFKLVDSQLNDYAIGCSTENAMVVQADIYDDMLSALKEKGAHVCSADEKSKLQNVLWVNGNLNGEIICTSAENIAKTAGFSVPVGTTCILVEETGIGAEFPFSGEKLSVVVAVYKYQKFDDAITLVNQIQAYSGAGHSCGIHSFNEERIAEYAMKTKTARVGIRCAQSKANSGNWFNGMPHTFTLGCGTWGGNITGENITWKHYINTTWVFREIPGFKVPTDEELFGDVMKNTKIL